MKHLKEVLQKLKEHDLHVHEIEHENGYAGFTQPLAHLVSSTHYVMHNEHVVHVGNVVTIERYALAL